MRSRSAFLLCFLLLGPFARPVAADDSRGIRLGETTTSKWRIGVVIRATGEVNGILATTPVPIDWPEQSVKTLSEEKTPHVQRLSYRTLDGSVKQLLISIPHLSAGDEASAVVTFEISKRRILEPADPTIYRCSSKPDRDLGKYLSKSPYIESDDKQIKALAAQIAKDEQAWQRTGALFDWVRANIKYEFAEQIKPAVQALKDRQGDCEELSSLFIALCRASKIPARAVWLPKHCYPEFYLLDDHGQGHWFPCQAAGADRQFGSMIEDRPILQKGDNFKVPEERGPQRYVKQFLSAKDAAVPPEVKFILEQVKE
jgi:transglutaminase-like putative cysteine protease